MVLVSSNQFLVPAYFLVFLGHRRDHSCTNTLEMTRLFILKFTKSLGDNSQPWKRAMLVLDCFPLATVGTWDRREKNLM